MRWTGEDVAIFVTLGLLAGCSPCIGTATVPARPASAIVGGELVDARPMPSFDLFGAPYRCRLTAGPDEAWSGHATPALLETSSAPPAQGIP